MEANTLAYFASDKQKSLITLKTDPLETNSFCQVSSFSNIQMTQKFIDMLQK